MIVFIFLGIINVVIIKFNYSKKLEKHIFAYLKYDDLILDIDYQLLKPRKYRENVNIFCSKIKSKYSYLKKK